MLLPSLLSVTAAKVSRIGSWARSASTIRWCRGLAASALILGVASGNMSLGVSQSAIAAPSISATAQSKRTFDQLMNVGYAASRQGDLNTALINFRRALALRPGNPYAAAAVDNMDYYIQHARYAARQQTITQLETRLVNAINQKDWVCAATTLDELTMYTKPNSLNRERLIGHRGEVAGYLDARLDYESWSTVCTAQRPVY
ncbi:hypothetical protein [cf. Phormidesmis sp. LEGE 11477]|uniref:hypothetical protein n=1 Tax=cf. Phormidesmis sp. LEGE 11477 TaxID=1828680 RepID=UPI00187FB3AD|nr:hypothetical protein [cf. Phormidesmis sp. LEGE 11477]MBE9059868.1 hypothetical protein [cf. Phormidesmis sp. LEGE 11477]